jgi:hypothetical protein
MIPETETEQRSLRRIWCELRAESKDNVRTEYVANATRIMFV